MEKENTAAGKTAFREKSKQIREQLAIGSANSYAREYDAGKGVEDPFKGLHEGCEVPMNFCQEKCGYRKNCRLRRVRNIIYNTMVTYGQAVESYFISKS